MPPLSVEALVASNRTVRKQKDESNEHYLARLTHVSVTGQDITKLEHLQLCPGVTSLYLYDNRIGQIEHLGGCLRLTHLYLQHNDITRIAGLGRLRNLTKLHLGYNRIAVIEGLEALTQLRELYVEHQTLPPGETLIFDPRSLSAIARSLNVLSVAGNGLDTLRPFVRNLDFLTVADISRNCVADLSQILQLTDANPDLRSLAIDGNPCCSMAKYREEIIVRTTSLTLLDGKEISPTYRQFLRQWKLALSSTRTRGDNGSKSAGPRLAPQRPHPGFMGSFRKPPRVLPPLERHHSATGALGSDL